MIMFFGEKTGNCPTRKTGTQNRFNLLPSNKEVIKILQKGRIKL